MANRPIDYMKELRDVWLPQKNAALRNNKEIEDKCRNSPEYAEYINLNNRVSRLEHRSQNNKVAKITTLAIIVSIIALIGAFVGGFLIIFYGMPPIKDNSDAGRLLETVNILGVIGPAAGLALSFLPLLLLQTTLPEKAKFSIQFVHKFYVCLLFGIWAVCIIIALFTQEGCYKASGLLYPLLVLWPIVALLADSCQSCMSCSISTTNLSYIGQYIPWFFVLLGLLIIVGIIIYIFHRKITTMVESNTKESNELVVTRRNRQNAYNSYKKVYNERYAKYKSQIIDLTPINNKISYLASILKMPDTAVNDSTLTRCIDCIESGKATDYASAIQYFNQQRIIEDQKKRLEEMHIQHMAALGDIEGNVKKISNELRDINNQLDD